MTVRWLADTCDADGHVLYRIGREEQALIAEWPGLAHLRCMPGHAAELRAEEGADAARFAKVRRGIARALVRSLDGAITLHASALERGRRGVLCLGASGAGKSTMVHSLCARPERQFSLLADDMCEVRWSEDPEPDLLALPGETAAWLMEAGSDVKTPVPLPVATAPAKVVALVCMSAESEAGAPRLEPLRGATVFARLVPCLVRFSLDDPEAHATELRALADLCRLPVFQLTRPARRADAEKAAELVAALLR